MTHRLPYLFVSYAHEDVDEVRLLVDAVKAQFRKRGVAADVWMDATDLKPGESWDATIAEALAASCGFLFFVSPHSLQSVWARTQLEIAAGDTDRLIIPVLLADEWTLELPGSILSRMRVRFTGSFTSDEVAVAALQIVLTTQQYLSRTSRTSLPPVAPEQLSTIAAGIAEQARSSGAPPAAAGRPDSVFVVHGHHTAVMTQVEEYLASVGVEPIVLARRDDSPQSLFQKFLTIGSKAHFAIVLFSADDYGASRLQYDSPGVADRALQFRARQNVLLELGFFYGKLGWENVFVVYQAADKVYPNFERPSDLDGVVIDSISDAGWKTKLGAKLSAAGFQLTAAV
jgi:predicted nucleotide-binding protein